jgi:hypothetical protein
MPDKSQIAVFQFTGAAKIAIFRSKPTIGNTTQRTETSPKEKYHFN